LTLRFPPLFPNSTYESHDVRGVCVEGLVNSVCSPYKKWAGCLWNGIVCPTCLPALPALPAAAIGSAHGFLSQHCSAPKWAVLGISYYDDPDVRTLACKPDDTRRLHKMNQILKGLCCKGLQKPTWPI
jgi:hypothetical protein